MAEQKRERGRNFTEMEKSQLVDIVLKYKDVTENKRTDKVSLLTKCKIWTQITDEYNAIQLTGKRETKTIKSLYEALKAKARKEKTAERVETMKTGGGPCPSVMSGVSSRLIGELGDQFEPLENQFDSSSEIFEQVPEKSDPVELQLEDSVIEEFVIGGTSSGEQIMIEEQPLPPLTTERPFVAARKRRRSSEQNIALENYSKGKIDVAEKKLELLLIEHNKRMKILNLEEEAASKKIQLLNLEEETAKLRLEKEKVDLEILNLKLNRELL